MIYEQSSNFFGTDLYTKPFECCLTPRVPENSACLLCTAWEKKKLALCYLTLSDFSILSALLDVYGFRTRIHNFHFVRLLFFIIFH